MKTKRKLGDFGKLTRAERQIVNEIDSGQDIVLGDGKLPLEDAGGDRLVNADFIRYLAIGGCDGCKTHEKGLQVAGALIVGTLDLEGCKLGRDLGLFSCRFLEKPVFQRARLKSLFLNGSFLHQGLNADGMEANGSVFLRRVTAEREVGLQGTKLGGNLDCDWATFNGPRDDKGNVAGCALNAGGMEAKGYVYLRQVRTKGALELIGAKLGGDLDCVGASFRNAGGRALGLGSIIVTGAFFLREKAKIEGILDLSAATVGILNDDADCWPKTKGDLILNRFRYGAIGSGPVDAKSRKEWLALQDPARFGQDFWPQPYEQLAKVLREMGHRGDAREILIEKEKLQRQARRKREAGVIYTAGLWVRDQLLNITVRYGHRPLLAFAWLIIFWSIGTVVFDYAVENSAFKPNSSRILITKEWVGCEKQAPSQLACYLATDPAHSYPKLNALVYSADTLLPIVDLEMQSNWIPDENVMPWARRYLWLQIIMGWALSLLAVAGFSGLIKSD
jgi:hypothetical protein